MICAHSRAPVQHFREVPYRLWWWPWRLRWRLIRTDCLAGRQQEGDGTDGLGLNIDALDAEAATGGEGATW